EQVLLQYPVESGVSSLRPFAPYLHEFAGDHLEAVAGGLHSGGLGGLFLCRWVATTGNQGAGGIPLFSGLCQGDFRVSPDGVQLLLSTHPVLHPPGLGPGGFHQQEQPLFVGQLVVLLAGLGGPCPGVCQRHGFTSIWGYRFLGVPDTPNDTPKTARIVGYSIGPLWTTGNKKAQ